MKESADRKWFWMMNYCLINRIPPAQKWAWGLAEKEYINKNTYHGKRKTNF